MGYRSRKVLHSRDQIRMCSSSAWRDQVHPSLGVARKFIPVHIAVVLPALGELPTELDSSKGAGLASDGTHELDRAVHIPWHVNGVADLNVDISMMRLTRRRRPRRHLGRFPLCIVGDDGGRSRWLLLRTSTQLSESSTLRALLAARGFHVMLRCFDLMRCACSEK